VEQETMNTLLEVDEEDEHTPLNLLIVTNMLKALQVCVKIASLFCRTFMQTMIVHFG
jgi:hypothetical protein